MIPCKFEEQVLRTPNNIAINTVTKTFTYRELNSYANWIAHKIRQGLRGAPPASRISLLFEHGPHMIAAILGTLKAGMAYVPLSTDYPENRLSYMVENAESALVLSMNSYSAIAAKLAKKAGCAHLTIDPGNALKSNELSNPGISIPSEQLAYIMYTSGSTGRPKGVMQTHENVLYYIRNWIRVFSITEADRMTLFSSFCHDGSVQDMIAALLSGAVLYPVNIKNRNGIDDLARFLLDERITIYHSVPSLFSYFTNTLTGRDDFKDLKYILLGGEAVREHEIKTARKFFPNSILANVYGQTESSVNSIRLMHPNEHIEFLTIGDPLDETEIVVLDKNDEEVEEYEVGEIMIGCRHISPGYWRNEEASRKAFSSDEELGTLYFTGDLGRLLPNGQVEFMGRRDSQVKIRGFRIELGEIESQLLKHPQVYEAVVLAREIAGTDDYESHEIFLCAYVVPSDTNEQPDEFQLREFLAQQVPDYMVPSFFMLLNDFPLTQSGKIDRNALPDPKRSKATYNPPRDDLEKEMVALWADVLKVEPENIGIDNDFFRMGGHSLRATALISKIHRVLDVNVPVGQLFKTTTIRGLVGFIKNAASETFVSLDPAPKKDFYPLSSAQKRLYILQDMDDTGISYNMPGIFIIEGIPQLQKLENAFKRLIERHESFRTSFCMIDEEPCQKIHEEVPFSLELFDIDNVVTKQSFKDFRGKKTDTIAKSAAPHQEIIEFIVKEFVQPFDLSRPPLLKAAVVCESGKMRYLMVDKHHIISDGTSYGILLRDLVNIYEGHILPPISIQYKDYCHWLNSVRVQESRNQQEKFWLDIFEGDIPVLDLPTDFRRPTLQRFEGNRIGFLLDKDITRKLREMAAEQEVTIYILMLTFFYVLLFKLSNQEDIVVGTVVAGRYREEFRDIIGMFVNTLALRNKPSGEKRFQQFLQEVKRMSVSAFENSDYAFEDLVEKVTVKRDISRNPVFDVMFRMQNYELDLGEYTITDSGEGFHLGVYDYNQRTAKFDLSLAGLEQGDQLWFKIEYSTNLFRPETIQRFIEYYQRIITIIPLHPNIRLWEIDLMSDHERKKLLFDFNDTRGGYPKEKNVYDLFMEQVTRTPDCVAVGCDDISLSYRELNEKASYIANSLRKNGAESEEIICLMVDRGIEMIVSILGILRIGGAYLPIDSKNPPERIEYILTDSNSNILLIEKKLIPGVRFSKTVLIMEECIAPVENTSASAVEVNPDSLAYIIYTSGTTGRPKGMMITHKNIVRLMTNDRFLFDFDQYDRWTMFHSYNFDFSVWEMYGALLYGGKVQIVPRMVAKDTVNFLELLKRERITILNQTPSAFYQLVAEELLCPESHLVVRTIIFGGEALQPLRLKEWKNKYPHTLLVNMFGITETTVHVTYKEIGDEEIDNNISNIGGPLPTLSVYVTGKHLELKPQSVPGELCVGGDGVGRGYLNRPELTHEKFVSDPYKKEGTIYRSGDLARMLPHGELEYLGRIDQQVKIRGFRIEPGEIEKLLLRCDIVKDAVVSLRTHPIDEDKFLCAYIVPGGNSTVESFDVGSLRKKLTVDLPDYMIPSYFVPMERIPVTPNGKVDFKALPEPNIQSDEEYAAPRSDTEKTMSAIWSDLLHVDTPIGIDDNFFQMGGHSLKATLMIIRIHKILNIRLELAQVFKTPTIRALASIIEASHQNCYTIISHAEEREYYPLSDIQERFYILNRMDGVGTAFNVRHILEIDGEIDRIRLEKTFIKLIQQHESLRTSFHMFEYGPVQKIHNKFDFALQFTEPGNVQASDPSIQTILESFVKPFRLDQSPIFRAALVKLNSLNHILVMETHHIVSDGTSLGILLEDFFCLYRGDVLSSLQYRYVDFTLWQTGGDGEKDIDRQEEYWLEQYKEPIAVGDTFADFTRPETQSFEGGRIVFAFERELVGKIHDLAYETGTTLHMILTSVINILIARYTDSEDVVIGTAVAGRLYAEFQDIVGVFINALPIRNFPKGLKTFSTFLAEVKENVLNAYENQGYPFGRLIDRLGIKTDAGRNPLFDVDLVVQNMDHPKIEEINGLRFKPYFYESGITQLDIQFYVSEMEEEILVNVLYAKALYKKSTMELFISIFKEILEFITSNSEILLKDIPIDLNLTTVDADEYKHISGDFDF